MYLSRALSLGKCLVSLQQVTALVMLSFSLQLYTCVKMPVQSKPRKHTMPNNNEEVQRETRG